MKKIRRWLKRIKKASIVSFAIGFLYWVLENLVGDSIVQFLNNRGISINKFIKSAINNPLQSSIIIFFAVFVIFIAWDITRDKKSEKQKIFFIPRRNKPGMWEEHFTWLEIVENVNEDTGNWYAVLKRLEFSKDAMKVNCLEAVSNSVAPRLQLSKGKISIASTKNYESTMVALEDGYKPLPKSDCYHIEVHLKNKNRVLAIFDGYLHFNYYGSEEVLWLEPSKT